MGPRGFRISLAQTATKEDCIEVEFSASEIIPCYRRAKHGTTSSPPARKGGLPPYLDYTGVCGWTGYGFWSLSLNMVYNFMRIFPTGYGQYDRHSISFFCPKHGQGVKPAASPLHPNID